MNVILLGAPGSGKGTQAKVLSRDYGLCHVSTGDIFREEMTRKTTLGQEAHGYISAGRLVPDRVVLDMVKSRLAVETRGLLFDGFPRTVEQAEGLDAWLESRGQEIDAVIFINVSEEAVTRRLCDRRTCAGCGKIYNLGTQPPLKPDVCDACGKPLAQREDDKPAVIARRLQVYRDQTEPLLAYYKSTGNFIEADGSQDPAGVTAAIARALGK
jgi:adenylate kinase